MDRCERRRYKVALALSALAMVIAATAPVHAQAATTVWTQVATPNVGTSANALAGVAAVAANDVWAVGIYRFTPPGSAPVDQSLAEHWNGTVWSVVRTSNVGSGDNTLSAVAAASANDVWAVGTFFDYASLAWKTLVEHWNGSVWSVVRSPSPSARYNALQSVAVAGPNDVWAVGIQQTSGTTIRNRTLIEHWNGSTWSVVPSPNAGTGNNYLLGLDVVSPTNVWAVGSRDSAALVEHWNGTSWSLVPSPNSPGGANSLGAVTGVAANDVWAVGYVYPTGAPQRTLTEHWNGTAWTIVASPNSGTGNNSLAAVAALSSTHVWAAGSFVDYDSRTLIERWDGVGWKVVASPSPGTDAYIAGLATLPATTVWAVGAFENGPGRTLALRTTNG